MSQANIGLGVVIVVGVLIRTAKRKTTIFESVSYRIAKNNTTAIFTQELLSFMFSENYLPA